jgi:hypothetical protein
VTNREPLEDALRALRDVQPAPDLAGRIKTGIVGAHQRSVRPAWNGASFVAASMAATFLVALVWMSAPGRGITQPPPPRSADLPATPSLSGSLGPTGAAASRAPAGLGPDSLVRALREFSLGPGLAVETGQSLLVIAGPTEHDGAPSYLLQHFGDLDTGYRPGGVTGWVPAATIDGLVAARNPICPATTDLRSVAALQPFEQPLCFGWPRQLTFDRVTARQRVYGGQVSTTWISDDGRPDFFTGLPVYGLTPELALPESGWFRVTGHFDDPAAIECGDPAQVAWCRERFVLTAVAPVDPPDTVLSGTWKTTSEAPIDGRTGHAMVWTGSEAVVWGGTSSSADPNESVFDGVLPRDGSAYDPVADRWRRIPNAPIAGRDSPILAWTGREVIAFGGMTGERPILDGAAWDPVTDRWREIAPAPLRGSQPIGGWLGGRLVVVTSTAAASYDPTADTWTVMPAAPIAAGWRSATVAADRLVLVAFGDGATKPVEWAAWDPSSTSWTHGEVPIDPLMAGSTLAGTAQRAVFPETGLQLDPVAGTWDTSFGCQGAGAAPVWTGAVLLSVTVAWDVRVGQCRDLPPAPPRSAPFDHSNGREFPVAVWTGRQYVTWSGGTGGDIVWVPKDGAVFTPENDLGPCCG